MAQTTFDWIGQGLAQGRYLVRAKLGEGGMGYVYRALDRNLDADVVVKVPRRSMLEDPEFAARFAREVRSLVRLAHPCVVKVTDVGEHDGVPFAVMQYLSGGSLEDYEARGPGSPAPANLAALADWLPGVASALDFVHGQGYVHRDVKPGNILFDAHGHVFLSDFGVAKAVAAGPENPRAQTAVTGAGLVLGTPEYMAPELIMGQSFDGRIDQYALAVTVYEMLAGRRPFESTSATALLVMQTTQEPAPLSEVEPRVPKPLSDAVARGLAKDPGRRFPTCAAFAEAVVLAASAAPGSAARSPSGRSARPDQVRLPCPSCQKPLVLPAALLSDPEKSRGKRLSCPSCAARLRVTDDGRSLAVAGPGSTTSAGFPVSPSTRPVVALRPQPADDAPARTVAVTAPPPSLPTVPVATPVETAVGETAVSRRGVSARTIGAAAAVLLSVALASVVLWQTLSRPKLGTLPVDASGLPTEVAVRLDGRPIDPSSFQAPLSLPPGDHELTVSGIGYQPFRQSFRVALGENPGFRVRLTRVPNAPPPPSPIPFASAPKAKSKKNTPPPPPVPEVAPEPDSPDLLASRTSVAPAKAAPRRPTQATFQPVPAGAAVENEPLSKLLESADGFANRVVVPTGLFLMSHRATEHRDGTVTGYVQQVALNVRGRNLAALERLGEPALIQIDLGLARNLHADNAISLYSNDAVGDPGGWGDNGAVLTFHVQKRTDDGREAWVPTLKKAEFLVGLNFGRIGEGKYKDSFRTLTVTPSLARNVGLSDRRDWSTRIGQSYIGHLKRLAHQYKNAKFANQMQQMDGAMNNMMGTLLRSNPDPTRALDAQFRARALGGS